jgi:hemoglobin/transferrin/lactoferrin receptor protein
VTDTLGVYVQDEISLFANRLSLTPGLRYDQTRLKPDVDALAQQVLTIINRPAVDKEFSHVSPKLGGQWRFNEELSLFGQIASGFRARTTTRSTAPSAIRRRSTPRRRTPTSRQRPAWASRSASRANVGNVRAQLTAYDNRYKDFIDNVRLNCPSDPNCVRVGGTPYTTYMYRNLSNVRIYGAESRASWAFARNWRVDGAIAYARGENTDTGVAINTVEPLRASFGLAYDVGQWRRVAPARGQRQEPVDDSGGAWFRTPGYGINDLAAWFRPTANTRFVVAVNNVFDQKYWYWADIRQADTSLTGVDFYSQPGRNVRVSFQADFDPFAPAAPESGRRRIFESAMSAHLPDPSALLASLLNLMTRFSCLGCPQQALLIQRELALPQHYPDEQLAP